MHYTRIEPSTAGTHPFAQNTATCGISRIPQWIRSWLWYWTCPITRHNAAERSGGRRCGHGPTYPAQRREHSLFLLQVKTQPATSGRQLAVDGDGLSCHRLPGWAAWKEKEDCDRRSPGEGTLIAVGQGPQSSRTSIQVADRLRHLGPLFAVCCQQN